MPFNWTVWKIESYTHTHTHTSSDRSINLLLEYTFFCSHFILVVTIKHYKLLRIKFEIMNIFEQIAFFQWNFFSFFLFLSLRIEKRYFIKSHGKWLNWKDYVCPLSYVNSLYTYKNLSKRTEAETYNYYLLKIITMQFKFQNVFTKRNIPRRTQLATVVFIVFDVLFFSRKTIVKHFHSPSTKHKK